MITRFFCVVIGFALAIAFTASGAIALFTTPGECLAAFRAVTNYTTDCATGIEAFPASIAGIMLDSATPNTPLAISAGAAIILRHPLRAVVADNAIA